MAQKTRAQNYKKLATILLPHDYLNHWFTGRAVMEYGDASGTALLNVRTRTWCESALKAIDPGLKQKLPELISSDQPAGHLQASTAKELGLSTKVWVSAGEETT